MVIPVALKKDSYSITLERGALGRAGQILNLAGRARKVLVLSDKGVPAKYKELLEDQFESPVLLDLEQGEESKSMESLKLVLETLVKNDFTRKDCLIALGGGVVGDLGGFAASCYMRGIDFYNIPTTLLAQVDSSVGGKTAIDFLGIKNIVGAFYQPKAVIIDPDVLGTLAKDQLASGKAEIIKMAATCDQKLFDKIEREGIEPCLEEMIEKTLRIKIAIVEADEREEDLRRVLNFGHTLGHGIESVTGLLHGQSVALGMLPMAGCEMRQRLGKVLEAEGLPITCKAEASRVIEVAMHDKKAQGKGVVTIRCNGPGTYEMVKADRAELLKQYTEVFS